MQQKSTTTDIALYAFYKTTIYSLSLDATMTSESLMYLYRVGRKRIFFLWKDNLNVVWYPTLKNFIAKKGKLK